jgi:hypothetical protein
LEDKDKEDVEKKMSKSMVSNTVEVRKTRVKARRDHTLVHMEIALLRPGNVVNPERLPQDS